MVTMSVPTVIVRDMVFRTGNGQRWTDDQLQAAISENRSWAGVMRDLGLHPTSQGSKTAVKRRVKELDLSTAHFTGQRRWSDAQLQRAVPESYTWAELLERLGARSTSAGTRAAVIGHAHRLGLPLDHLSKPKPEPKGSVHRLPILQSELRYAASSLATTWFLLRGCPVSVPAEPAPYDLLVELPEGVQKVQVKSVTRRDRYGSFQVGIAPVRTHGPDLYMAVPYDPRDVDMFFIVDGDGGIYLIPMEIVAGRSTLSVNAYQAFKRGSAKSMLTEDTGEELAEAA